MSDVLTPRTHGSFLKALNSNRNETEYLSFEDAVKKAEKEGGTTLFEVLKDGELYIVFTDCDHYCETAERPPTEFIDHVFLRMEHNLIKFLEGADYRGEGVHMATRHGLCPRKKVYKLSFRCYLPGFVSTLAGVRDVIVRKGLHKIGIGSFDIAPYNKNQLLGCVGFYKTEEDRRILIPEFDEPLQSFIVQRVTGKERILKYINEDVDDSDQTETEHDDAIDFHGSRFAPPWDILERLVMSLDVQARCVKGSYHVWTRVGWAIAGVARAAKRIDDGFDLWLDFCRQIPQAYNENPLKAWQIYQGANSRGEQLGWKSLMESLKVDNVDVYNEIRGQLGSASTEVITDEKIRRTVTKFIDGKYRCRPGPESITFMKVVQFGDKKYLVVESSDVNCPIIIDKHTPVTTIYFVIGLSNTKEKCHFPDCRDKHGNIVDAASYPEDLREILNTVLKVDNGPQMVLSKLVRSCDESQTMELGIGDMSVTPLGNEYELPTNRYCPIHKCKHENPENCLMLTSNFQRVGITCRKDQNRYGFYPAEGIVVPQNMINIFIQNANFTTNVDTELTILSPDYAGDNLPFFLDQPNTRSCLVESFSGKHNDIARFVHAIWGHEFRFFNKNWHSFEGHIWTRLDDVPILRDRLSTSLCKHYAEVQLYYRDNLTIDRAKQKIELLEHTISGLKVASFKDSVMKEVQEVFLVENRGFAKALNTANLLPFTNGVIDLETFEFRPGRPEDKMSMSTNIEYIAYDGDSNESALIDAFMASILPDEQVRSYCLKVAALSLTRETKYQHFWILSGSGSNGKSLFLDLLTKTLGDFVATTRVTLLTGKSESANGSEEPLAKLESKRLALFNEPSGSSTIQADVIKRLVGGTDKISTRKNFGSENEFVPVFTPILACNTIPKISEDTYAIWRRIRVVHFPVLFCDEPDPENELEKLSDETLPERMNSWPPNMAGYLVHWLKILREEGLSAPDAVQESSNEYKDENDAYKEFIEKYLERAHKDCYIQWTDLLAEFRPWHDKNPKWNALSIKGKDVQAIKQYFSTKLGKIRRTELSKVAINGYFGWRFKVESTFVEEEVHGAAP